MCVTRGNSSGSIQMMLRLGLLVFSCATSFRISRNSKPSEWAYRRTGQRNEPAITPLRSNPESHTWVVLLGEGNDVLAVNVVLLWTRKDAENVRLCRRKHTLSESFSYPDLIHAVRVKLPQSGPGTFKTTEEETGLVEFPRLSRITKAGSKFHCSPHYCVNLTTGNPI